MKKLFGYERAVEAEEEENNKVFISGPMTGYEDYNRKAFNDAEKMLVDLGYSVFNPAWLKVDETWSHDDLLDIDIRALTKCKYIYQLPGWSESDGALREDGVARMFGIIKLELGQFDI